VLFDLQTPRRRRVVRVVFGGLALIFAISFVFLGVGTGGGGFSFSDLFGGGGGSSSTAFDSDIEAAQAKLQANPQDTTALGNLVRLHYSAGTQNVTSSGQLTSDGTQHLQESADAWNKYVKLAGKDANPSTATFAVQGLAILADQSLSQAAQSSGPEALNLANVAVDYYKAAAGAQQITIDSRPKQATTTQYLNLAYFYYRGGDLQQGAKAAALARSVAQPNEKSQIEASLKQLEQQGTQLKQGIARLQKLVQQSQQSQGASGGGATGGGGGANPLSGLGTGGLSGGGGL
jgi:hypothetical protein